MYKCFRLVIAGLACSTPFLGYYILLDEYCIDCLDNRIINYEDEKKKQEKKIKEMQEKINEMQNTIRLSHNLTPTPLEKELQKIVIAENKEMEKLAKYYIKYFTTNTSIEEIAQSIHKDGNFFKRISKYDSFWDNTQLEKFFQVNESMLSSNIQKYWSEKGVNIGVNGPYVKFTRKE